MKLNQEKTQTANVIVAEKEGFRRNQYDEIEQMKTNMQCSISHN